MFKVHDCAIVHSSHFFSEVIKPMPSEDLDSSLFGFFFSKQVFAEKVIDPETWFAFN